MLRIISMTVAILLLSSKLKLHSILFLKKLHRSAVDDVYALESELCENMKRRDSFRSSCSIFRLAASCIESGSCIHEPLHS